MSQEGKPIGKKHVKVMIALQEEFQVRHISATCDESTRKSLCACRTCLRSQDICTCGLGLLTTRAAGMSRRNHNAGHRAVQMGNWDVEADEEIPHSTLISGSALHSVASAPLAAPKSALARTPAALPAQQPAKRFRSVAKGGTAPAPTPADANVVPVGAHLLHEAEAGGKAVFVAANLVRHLRPHQIEGVTFLYNVRDLNSWRRAGNMRFTRWQL